MLALVTADAADGLDPDLAPLADALRRRLGDEAVSIVSWDAPIAWTSFDAVVIRSTWDYTDRLEEFLAWVEQVESSSRLVNAGDAVRWSVDKGYLADLAADGVPITPTEFVPPGSPVPAVDAVRVVKPTVGAGSSGARRCPPAEVVDHVNALHTAGRTAMIQPYLGGLDEHGETALCYVAGADGGLVLSHAFRKGPILAADEIEQVGGLFAAEEISSRTPTPAEIELGAQVLAAPSVARLGDLAFVRIDIAPHGPGGRDDPRSLVVVELELVEPSFYLETSPGSAERFADALIGFLARDARQVAPSP